MIPYFKKMSSGKKMAFVSDLKKILAYKKTPHKDGTS